MLSNVIAFIFLMLIITGLVACIVLPQMKKYSGIRGYLPVIGVLVLCLIVCAFLYKSISDLSLLEFLLGGSR